MTQVPNGSHEDVTFDKPPREKEGDGTTHPHFLWQQRTHIDN